MKDKVLIIGNPGTGKTRLAKELAAKFGYTLVDNLKNIEEVKKKATPNTIYVSDGIDERVIAALSGKADTQNGLMDMVKELIKKYRK